MKNKLIIIDSFGRIVKPGVWVLMLFLVSTLSCYAALDISSGQDSVKVITVKGNVIDEFGYTVVGAKVFIKGDTVNTTITNPEGNYKITAKKESNVLVFSMDGYLKKEVTIKKRREIDVELKIDRDKK